MDANELVAFISSLKPGDLVLLANSSGTFSATYRLSVNGRTVSGVGRNSIAIDAIASAKEATEAKI